MVAGLFYDTVIEGAGAGTDFVNVTPYVSSGFESYYTLGANIENGGIAATMAFNLIGNGLNNVLTGNIGINQLIGEAGNDTLNGLGGLDRLFGGVGNDAYILTDLTNTLDLGYRYDTVTEDAGAGIDTAVVTAIDNPDTASSIDRYTLGANIENGTIAGGLAFNLTGNALNNTLTGNAAANTLTGNDGNDTLNGLGGLDTLIGSIGNDTYVLTDLTDTLDLGYRYDTIVESAAAGIDTVAVTAIDNPDTASPVDRYTLGANVENGTIVGATAFNLTGNELINRLVGNSAGNTLNGLAGADTMFRTRRQRQLLCRQCS